MPKKKKEELPLYNLVPDDDIEEIGDDIDEIGEDTDEILRRIDRNTQRDMKTLRNTNWLVFLWIVDKVAMFLLFVLFREIFI